MLTMTSLSVGLGLLLLAALGLVGWSLRPRAVLASGVDNAQNRFYRQRRNEITAEFQQGLLDARQRDELELELDRQLLEEATGQGEQKTAHSPSSPLLLPVVAGLLIALSVGVYQQLGYSDDLRLQQLQQRIVNGDGDPAANLAAYQRLLGDIIDSHPDSADHLVVMTGLLRQRGDYPATIPYYQKLLELYPNDPELMAQLGQARYLGSGRQLDAQTLNLLNQALQLEPTQATALGVLGIDAFAHGDHTGVLKYWQPLLGGLPPGSAQFNLIASGVQQARLRAVAAGQLSGLSIRIEIAEAALTEPGILFVVAREPSGMPMPVAALKLPVTGQSSQQLVLTDGDVIRPGLGLKDFPKLQLSAHISRRGVANRGPGDWLADAVTVNVADSGELTLVIDSQL